MVPRYEILPQFEIISVPRIIVTHCYQSKNIYLLQVNILLKKKEYKYISFFKKKNNNNKNKRFYYKTKPEFRVSGDSQNLQF